MTQEQIPLHGHAIEVRLYAEDPDQDFLPASGTLTLYREPSTGRGRRVDSGVSEGDSISPFYDPMLAKLVAWGETREQARLELLDMLRNTSVAGVKTNLRFLEKILAHPAFAAQELDTGFIVKHTAQLLPKPAELDSSFWYLAAKAWLLTRPAGDDCPTPPALWQKLPGWRAGLPTQSRLHLRCAELDQVFSSVSLNNASYCPNSELLTIDEGTQKVRYRAVRKGADLYLNWHGVWQQINTYDPIEEAGHAQQSAGGLQAPMNGSVVRVMATVGQQVEAGAPLLVLEAMKMEHSIRAPTNGRVKAVFCGEGDLISEGTMLVEMEESE
tara:strand:- start:540 stop:1520 length:981 start_codon:yes stop_codon:yes gene_type:complete